LALRKISICIPVFNEAESLPVAVSVVETLFREKLTNYELELILTDNASTDATWAVAVALAAGRPHLKAFRFSRNFGYQNSVFTGISMASGDAVIELDADLEDPPDVIVEFVKRWEEGFEVVYGVRRTRHAPFYLKFFFWLFYKILRFTSSLDIPENSGDFRLLDRKVANVLKQLPERNLYLRGLVTFLGFRQTPVYYDRQPRIAGRSKFRFIHYVTLAIDGITAVSKTPLRAIGVLGFAFFSASVLLGAYYIGGALLHQVPVQGFTTIVVLMLLLHGLNFIFVGVIGEYLSRIFDDAKGRPRVIIAQAINAENSPESL
jgi:glycosyltransferase involved in cell wall biosynthesis